MNKLTLKHSCWFDKLGNYEAIENAQTLDEIGFPVKKLEASKKLKAFRVKLNDDSSFRIGFFLEEDTIVLVRVLNRKEIYNAFPPT